jgi:outer membrane immunogenic protein
MIRTFTVAAALLALIGVPAVAADIPARMPAKAPPAAVVTYNWSGFYTATTIGGGWQDIDGVGTVAPFDAHRVKATRFWTGSHVGYQVMLNQWVVGIEGSFSAPWDKDYATANTGSDCFAGTADRTCHSRIKNIWTVGGKAGRAFGNWMVYGAGGYANGRIEQFASVTSTGVTLGGNNLRHDGWYAGGGVDMLVTRVMWSDLILGVEYRHYDFSRRGHPDVSGVAANDHSFRATVDTIMAKATFKWVGAGPFAYFRRQ